MTTLTRFVLTHAVIGSAAAVLFVAFLLLLDVGGIGSLAMATEGGFLAVAVMTAFFAITFGSAQIGFALMFAFREDEGAGGSRAPRRRLQPALAPVPARAARPGAPRR